MANRAAGTYEVDPISRIEGHLGVKVTTDGTKIVDAKAHGNLWRGFENFLVGRDANDAITFTQRICGVCPVPHGLAATYAADTVLGYSNGHITFKYNGTDGVPDKAVLIRNLVLGCEFLMSSITHFYHLAAPSYVQGPSMPPWTPYFADSYYYDDDLGTDARATLLSGGRALPENVQGFSKDLWSTVIRSYVKALRIRRLTFEAGALFAGRMPMTSCFVGGGVTFDGTENLAARCQAFRDLTAEIGDFVIKEYVPIVLALGRLYTAFDNTDNGGQGYGAGLGVFLSWGAFPNLDDTLTLKGGLAGAGAKDFTVSNRAQVNSLFLAASGLGSVKANLKEDISNSRYAISAMDAAAGSYSGTAAFPGDVWRTEPERANGYTYMKAPRWNGESCEVGPLARLVVSGLYPVNGSTLLSTVNPTGLAGYAAYAKTVDTQTGIDPAMIEADIAVALVRSGLAELWMWNGTDWFAVNNTGTGTDPLITGGYLDVDSLNNATIVAAYTGASVYGEPVIMGRARNWIVGLKGGLSTMDRVRARALESLVIVQKLIGAYSKTTGWPAMGGWIGELNAAGNAAGSTWRDLPLPAAGKMGWGAVEAPRGSLMHVSTIDAKAKITKYQCIVPTTWNGSPAVGTVTLGTVTNRGAIEAACIDVPFDDAGASFTKAGGVGTVSTAGGVEVLRVAQSFDPCIACAVH